jgi:hypothetical protein
MDPYLEEPGLWPDVHLGLISQIQAQLNQRLRPKYHVRVEERVYVSDENDPGREVIIPDLRVADAGRNARDDWSAAETAGVYAAVAEPVVLTTLIDDEIHEAFLEVIDRADQSVVTVIEILSPTNKVSGSRGRASYQEKRREIMTSASHLVEIDLLRAGVAIHTRELLPPADYYVHVSRKAKRPKAVVWPILLTQRLPVIAIPLRPEDADAPLDLQEVLTVAYDRAAYDMAVDYRREPVPPLTEPQQCWAHALLHSRGLRATA